MGKPDAADATASLRASWVEAPRLLLLCVVVVVVCYGGRGGRGADLSVRRVSLSIRADDACTKLGVPRDKPWLTTNVTTHVSA